MNSGTWLTNPLITLGNWVLAVANCIAIWHMD